MRKLTLKDTFTVSKILKKLDFKNAKFDFNKKTEELGQDVMYYIIDNIDKVETDVYELLASLYDISVEEVQNKSIFEIIEDIKANKALQDFFQKVSALETQQKLQTSCLKDTQV